MNIFPVYSVFLFLDFLVMPYLYLSQNPIKGFHSGLNVNIKNLAIIKKTRLINSAFL